MKNKNRKYKSKIKIKLSKINVNFFILFIKILSKNAILAVPFLERPPPRRKKFLCKKKEFALWPFQLLGYAFGKGRIEANREIPPSTLSLKREIMLLRN